MDAPDAGALGGGGEGGCWDRDEAWCLVRIHSGPKCMVVVDICDFQLGEGDNWIIREVLNGFSKILQCAAGFTRGK